MTFQQFLILRSEMVAVINSPRVVRMVFNDMKFGSEGKISAKDLIFSFESKFHLEGETLESLRTEVEAVECKYVTAGKIIMP